MGKESLLLKWCGGLTVQEVLSTSVDDFCDAYPTDDDLVEFVRLKHLLALQKGLGALMGLHSARPDDAISLESVVYGPLGTEMIATIKVDTVTEEIRACGRCVGCGTSESAPSSHVPE